MVRSFEEIRAEVLGLDEQSQLRLAHEIEARIEDPNFIEAKRRSDAVARHEMKTVDGPEALQRVQNLVKR
jgi:hypothetical protein